MTIRSKIILITIPLIVTPLILSLLVAVLSSRNGITNVATRLLTFKSRVLINYMDNQWLLLSNHGLSGNADYIRVSKSSVESYAETLIDNREELIFAIEGDSVLAICTGENCVDEEILGQLTDQFRSEGTGWQSFRMNGKEYIADVNYFSPFAWFVVNAVERNAFYGAVMKIVFRIIWIVLISILFSVILLLIFSKYLTRPLHRITEVIRQIITTYDLSSHVKLYYADEIGDLGHYFNIMMKELEAANHQIRSYALNAVVSKRNEIKIRNIFQKYVPNSVIEKFYMEPESMLEGDSRVLGVLFSDIRNFTDFSESKAPHEVVESLNKYFEYMVDCIMGNDGIVDKYIGDAIMAFFGAPVHHSNDALKATTAGLDMLEKLGDFNDWQIRYERHPFRIGVGINYGVVTVGNIGTEKKMDYTVIGDMVNLASRLESLTKNYQESILISDSVYKKVHEHLPCRLIDRVVVKGKTNCINIYSVRKEFHWHEKEAWAIHEKGLEHYYNREFSNAAACFRDVTKLLPHDFSSSLFLKRSLIYEKKPPDKNWTGDIVLQIK